MRLSALTVLVLVTACGGSGGPATGVPGDGTGPPGPTVDRIAPNPFNPQTVIGFELPAATVVHLVIHDVSGRHVRVLLDGVSLPAGFHDSLWKLEREQLIEKARQEIVKTGLVK